MDWVQIKGKKCLKSRYPQNKSLLGGDFWEPSICNASLDVWVNQVNTQSQSLVEI